MSVLRPEVPDELAGVVARMMAKDPARRYPTPAAAAAALVPFFKPAARPAGPASVAPARPPALGRLEPTAPPPPTPPAPPPVVTEPPSDFAALAADPRRPRGRRGWLAGGLTVGLLLTALALAWAAGAFRVKSPHGTIVLENLPEGAEVLVDGNVVAVSRNGDEATVTALPAGTHGLKVVLGGRELLTSDVVVKLDGEPVRVRVEDRVPPPDPIPPAGGAPGKPAADLTPRLLHVLRGHGDRVAWVLFTPDGSRVVSASNGDHHEFKDKRRYHIVGADNSVRVWNAVTGKEVRKFPLDQGRRYGAQGIAVSPDGKTLAVAASWIWANAAHDPRVYVIDIASTAARQLPIPAGPAQMRAIAFSDDGQTVHAVRCQKICTWAVAGDRDPDEVLLDEWPRVELPRMTLTAGGRFVLGGFDRTNEAYLWDRATGKVLKRFVGHHKTPNEVVLSPDGRRVLTCADDYSVRLWDAESAREVYRVDNLDSNVTCVAFAPDGQRFLTGSADGLVVLRESATGKEVARLTGHAGRVNIVAFSPVGGLFASAGDDKTVRVWGPPPAEAAGPTVAARMDKLPPVVADGEPWLVVGDELISNSAATRHGEVFFGDPTWADYDLRFRVNLPGRNRDETRNQYANVRLHASGRGTYRVLEFGGWKNEAKDLYNVIEHRWTDRQGGGFVRPGLRLDHWHDVRVQVRREKIEVVFDGEKIITGSDPRYTSGRIGFFHNSGTAVRFRDVQVKDPAGVVLWTGVARLGIPVSAGK